MLAISMFVHPGDCFALITQKNWKEKMPVELVLLLLLVATFVVGIWSEINIGIVALLVAFLAGMFLLDMSASDVASGFPDSLFAMLIGVTLLMGIANLNGTTDFMVSFLVKATGGNLLVMPWALFFIGLISTSVGAVTAPILLFIAVGFAAQYRVNPLLMGVMVIHGCQAGLFSPVALYGILFAKLANASGFDVDGLNMYVAVVVAHCLLVIPIFFLLGGKRMLQGALTAEDHASDVTNASREEQSFTPLVGATLLGIFSMVVGVGIMRWDIGVVTLAIAMVLLLFSHKQVRHDIVNQVAWPVIMIVSGVLILVGVLQEANAFLWLADQAKLIGSPLIIGLVLCLIAAAVTAVSSTFGAFGVLIPMAAPFIVSGELPATALIAALAISSAVTDVSPFSTFGALFVATAKRFDQQVLIRQCILYALAMTVTVPFVAWLALIAF